MSGGDRGLFGPSGRLIIGVVLIWGFMALLPLVAQYDGQGGRRAEKAAAYQIEPSPPRPAAYLADDQAKAYQPRCKGPQSREEAGLCVELRAAAAAEQANMISDRGFWVTFWGTIAVLISVIFTAWAAVAASRAARAAERSVSHANESMVTQLRPYVSLDRTNFEIHRGNEIETWRVILEWKNTGQTPARNVSTTCSSLTAEGLPEGFDFPDYGPPVIARSLIGPGQIMRVWVDFPPDQVTRLKAREGRGFAWGWIEYDDSFPGTPRHRTENSFEVVLIGIAADGSPILMSKDVPGFSDADEFSTKPTQTQKRTDHITPRT